MLTFLHTGTPRFPHGEYAILRATSDTAGQTYSFNVYATNVGKYLSVDEEFNVDAAYEFTSEVHTMPSGTEVHTFKINTTTLATDDLLVVSVTGTNGDATVYDPIFVEAGSFVIADNDITVEVYGFLRDAYGKAVRDAPISFTVLNTTTYFDNSPSTNFNATTLTNDKGKFSIHLNRNYNYVLSIHTLNYLKAIKLSELPATATVVEVDLGTGLGA